MDLVETQLDDENDAQAWSFETILDHRKQNGKWEILVLWTTGEETWEILVMSNSEQSTVQVVKIIEDKESPKRSHHVVK